MNFLVRAQEKEKKKKANILASHQGQIFRSARFVIQIFIWLWHDLWCGNTPMKLVDLAVGKARLTRFSVGCFLWAFGLRAVGVWGFRFGGLYFCGFSWFGCFGFSFAWSS
jgi:hypothetical protein